MTIIKFGTPGADAFLGGTALPSTLYLQMHTGDPGTNGTSNVATETDRITLNSWTTPAAGDTGYRSIETDTLAELLNTAATENITYVTLWSASSGGTCWFVINLEATVALTAGQNVDVDAGAAVIQVPIWT